MPTLVRKDRFLWEIFPEIKVLSAEIRVRKYTYNRREILVWAKPDTDSKDREQECVPVASCEGLTLSPGLDSQRVARGSVAGCEGLTLSPGLARQQSVGACR